MYIIIYTSLCTYAIIYLVKLKKVLSRRDKDLNREYYRYDITLPNEVIEELGWENIKELNYEIKGKELRIKRK